MVLAKSALCHMGPPESLHHTWYGVAIHVVGKKIRCYLDRRLVLEAEDEQPLEKGQLGIWTRNNRISIARATLSLSEVEQEPKESSKSEVRSAK
jgi:hypothetical protein